MLDVHSPHHRISEKRDFFIHLFTITVGLLIALAFENAAEAWHHHHLRHEAEENIRQEMDENLSNLKQDVPQQLETRNQLVLLIQRTEQSSIRTSTNASEAPLRFTHRPLEDAAWRTALSTGALSYMPYAEVQRMAAVYQAQEMVNTASEKTIGDYLELLTYISPHLQTTDLSIAPNTQPVLHHALADFDEMLALSDGTKRAYEKALHE